jgi:Ca2+-transporting ATPase
MLGSTHSVVRRSGSQQVIDTKELVPGDLVFVEAGDRIGADLRVLLNSQLASDESSLTGESLPINKSLDALPAATFIADRKCMLFSGTTVTAGSGMGVVTATGTNAEIGKIASLVEEAATSDLTPLEKRLDRLAQTLLWLTLFVATLVAIIGLSAGKPTILIIETAIALAVASVPEGLPVLATMILARGVHRMARKNALVQRLAAVETLGATGIICTDKTGTLTENRMHVNALRDDRGVIDAAEERYQEALLLGAWCNNAALGAEGEEDSGDPLEIALLRAASPNHFDERPELLREVAFDPETRMMATLHQVNGEILVAVKGAPEAVVAAARAKTDRAAWLHSAEIMASKGQRVIAVARRTLPSPTDTPYQDLEIVALIGLLDPPRPDVKAAILDCRGAGIEVCMMTGDHPATARHIAERVGIVDDANALVLTGTQLTDLDTDAVDDAQRIEATRVFARVSPEQKLRLVEFHQARGRVVAMTGDGVNDAPALRKADIGVAMGLRGTEVAREASEVVLLDDAFSSIVTAVREGRGVFANIRTFIVYLLSCNLSEILVVGLATAARAPLPLLPLQILFLNLVTDVFPALALGANETDPAVMQQAPRKPKQKILERREWRRIVGYGLLITASVLGAFFVAITELALSPKGCVSVAFLTLALAQVWHVFNMGTPGATALKGQVVRNKFVWAAVALCLVLLALTMYWQPAATILSLQALGWKALLLCVTASAIPLLAGVVVRRVGRLRQRRR